MEDSAAFVSYQLSAPYISLYPASSEVNDLCVASRVTPDLYYKWFTCILLFLFALDRMVYCLLAQKLFSWFTVKCKISSYPTKSQHIKENHKATWKPWLLASSLCSTAWGPFIFYSLKGQMGKILGPESQLTGQGGRWGLSPSHLITPYKEKQSFPLTPTCCGQRR